MENYFIGILILIFSGIFSLFFKNSYLKLKFLTLCATISTGFLLNCVFGVYNSGTIEKVFEYGSVFGNIRFSIDYLSAFFIFFISILTTLGMIYANGYLSNYIKKKKDITAHCVFLPVLTSSMLLVVGVQNALAFLIIWEMMSLSSFFLVMFEHENKETRKAGIKYLIYMHVSVIFIILAFALMSIAANSFDFKALGEILKKDFVLANLVFVLGFIGFGIKAGFAPFHNWLPSAHPAAPSHVSGIMSAVMIKTGIYGIFRILSFILIPSCQIACFVVIISVLTMLYGILYAIGQQDIKKLLAYSSIENIGIIGLGLGIGMLGLAYNCPPVAFLGFLGSMLHILNHSIFKELLFFAAGSVYSKAHTRDIELLGGLMKNMPKTGLLFLTGAVSICALPPFNGFIGEFLIYFGMLKGILIDNISAFLICLLSFGALALVGTMAILCFTKAFSAIFLGEKREKSKDVLEEAKSSFIFPMSILAFLTLFIGLFPKAAFLLVLKPVSMFTQTVYPERYINTIQTISIVFTCLITFIGVLALIRHFVSKGYKTHVTWGCGYNKPNEHMQYSASSYVSPMLVMLMPLFKKVSDIKKPKTIFPNNAHFVQHLEDVEEEYFLKPILKQTERFFARFERIQNGNIQQYISYGIIFLVIVLIVAILLG